MASTETLIAQLALSTGPRSSSPVWTTVTGFLDDVQLRRGRQHELDTIEAGVVQKATFDNSDRRFDPTYTGSPYYPYVLPTRRFRLSATLSATTYYIYSGYVERWPPDWQGPGYSETTVTCSDGFEPLAQADLVGTFPQELTSARVTRVLDAIGWPAGDRVIGTGNSLVAAVTFDAGAGQKALDHLLAVATTENGLFFIDGQGRAVFRDRATMQMAPYTTSQATFGDTGSDLHYEDAEPSFDTDLLYNSVTVTDSDGTAATVSDAPSTDAYWPRSLNRDTLLPAGSAETTNAAEYLLATHKDPALRFDRLEFIASLDDTLMLQALSREIGDRITVKKTPPGGGAQISQQCLIQSIAHSIRQAGANREWRTIWELAPADINSYWILDSSTLDTDTKLAY
jgi:hypothetical protein